MSKESPKWFKSIPQYRYELPEQCIAKVPADPPDSASLMVCRAGEGGTQIVKFAQISEYLPKGALLVMNDTKVVPARLQMHSRASKEPVEVLILVNEYDEDSRVVPAMVTRNLMPDEDLVFENKPVFRVIEPRDSVFMLRVHGGVGDLFSYLTEHATTPIPAYLLDTPLDESELRGRYQSLLAQNPASAAAPTASLHFTDPVFKSIQHKGISVETISLHVGIGTFGPIMPENVEKKTLHKETYSIPQDTVKAIRLAKKEGRPVVAVGTTVVRALESASESIFKGEYVRDMDTSLFILPPYEFNVVDGLVTNFHVPGSSLMALVDAFLQFKQHPIPILGLYEEAKQRGLRFLSFGDAMIIF